MVLIAQLATSGGVRAPLVKIADQVFADLTTELQNQGVTKKVIADMFGLALRTYHRRVQETRESQSEVGQTIWEAVLNYVREHEPVSAGAVLKRFAHDDHEVVSGVLNDLASSGLAERKGRGDKAIYRVAPEQELEQADEETIDWLVWLTVYRKGPLDLKQLVESARISEPLAREALVRLQALQRVSEVEGAGEPVYSSARFETLLGSSQGWEAAVLDHFQAMSGALCSKLSSAGRSSATGDTIGGSTWTLEVWDGHPLQDEARTTLKRLRTEIEELRTRVDAHNVAAERGDAHAEKIVVYLGQNQFRED